MKAIVINTQKIIILIIVTSLTFLCNCSVFENKKHPTDEALIENFKAHRTEFDKLLQMFQEDKALGRVANDFTRPENAQSIGITRERLNEYRKMFAELGLKSGIEGYNEKESVWFHSSSLGLAVTGSSKGYAHLKNPPEHIADNLDAYQSENGKSFTGFRQLDGNWYLYLDYED